MPVTFESMSASQRERYAFGISEEKYDFCLTVLLTNIQLSDGELEHALAQCLRRVPTLRTPTPDDPWTPSERVIDAARRYRRAYLSWNATATAKCRRRYEDEVVAFAQDTVLKRAGRFVGYHLRASTDREECVVYVHVHTPIAFL